MYEVTEKKIPVPCGKCTECRKRRASHWSFRLRKEGEVSTSSFFVTLTLAEEHMTYSPKGYRTIQKKHLQDFLKRLRQHEERQQTRYRKYIADKLQGKKPNPFHRPPRGWIYNTNKTTYYAVGEYGGRFKRPHYHAIIFNTNVESILRAWQLGTVHIGDVSGASIGYTLKYISKGRKAGIQEGDDRVGEFSLMSKGLGKNYITEKSKKWHTSDLTGRVYCTVEGKKLSMPRYYKQKIYHESQLKAIAWHNKNEEIKRREQELKELEKNPNYLHNKQQAKEASERALQKKQKQNDKL